MNVNYGANQSFSVSPNTGYHIDSVVVDGVNLGAVASQDFTNVTANHTIAAYFSINVYTITATASAGGRSSPSGAVNVNYGGNQSFTIAPNTGYHIDSVVVDGVNQGAIASHNFTQRHRDPHDRGILLDRRLHDHGDGLGRRIDHPRRARST